jgi:dephospho-CoA kinase
VTSSRPFLLVGLTGGIATGKSTVDALLRDLGAEIIDADVLAREVVEPGEPALDEIVAEFGRGVLEPGGRLDRKALGAIVFADPERRRKLEAITHPRILERFQRRLDALAARDFRGLVFFDAPVMIESGNYRNMDRLVVVITDEPTQIARLVARDGIARDEALRKIRSQMPLVEKAKLADYVIDNSGDRDTTTAEVRRVHAALAAEAHVSSRLLERAGHGRTPAPLGVVFPVDIGNRGRNEIAVAEVFSRLRRLDERVQFIAHHWRRSGNFVFVRRDADADARAIALVSSLTKLDCIARRFCDLFRLDWQVPSDSVTRPRGSVVLNDLSGTWRVVAVFLSQFIPPPRQITGNVTSTIKIVSWSSARDIVCAYHRPGEAGDVGHVSRTVANRLREGRERSSLSGSARALGVLRDIIAGRNLRP